MTTQALLRGTMALLATFWLHTSVAQGSQATEVVNAYVSDAVAAVNTIYESKLDALERSTLISESGLSAYWVSGRQTVIEGRGSGAAFAVLLGFRPDTWTLGDFRQAGDFGEMAAQFSRTKTFRSGEQSTTTKQLVYELVKVDDSWAIASFRTIEEEDTEATAWDKESSNVTLSQPGMDPIQVAKAQLDLLQGLPPQALRSASEKSAPLWQDTREARQGQGRVISTVATMTSFAPGPVNWTLTLVKQGVKQETTATVKAEVISDTPMAFSGLLFSLEKTNNQWLLSGATVTR